MRGLALASTAVGSLALGVLAAGWLVVLTPNPARSILTVDAYERVAPAITAKDDAVASAIATSPTRHASVPLLPADSRSASPPAIVDPSKSSPPLLAAAKPVKASAPIVAVVKRRLAVAAALILPPRHPTRDIPPAERRRDGVLTASEVDRIRVLLRLSSDQETYWPPVAEMLKAVGRRQMAASKTGEAPDFGTSSDLMRFYFAAQPLLRSLRGDQKAEVRRLARRMGLGSVESYI